MVNEVDDSKIQSSLAQQRSQQQQTRTASLQQVRQQERYLEHRYSKL